MDFDGVGLIDRIWMTIDDRSAYMCRFVDQYVLGQNDKPAVSAPVGDFSDWEVNENRLRKRIVFQRRRTLFISHIKMPFKSHAKIELVNDTDKDLDI